MSDEQIDEAAHKWRRRLDTKTIARQLALPEHIVYNHLWRIRLRAQPPRAA